MANNPIEKIGRFEVKQVGAESDRVLRFIGTDESEDRDGDIIKASGWDFTNFKNNPVFLPFHQYDKVPIGKCVALNQAIGSTGTSFDIKFPTIADLCSDPTHPSNEALLSDTIYNAYKCGIMSAVSVGFIGKESVKREDQKELPDWLRGNIFTSQELLELSAVSVPSNPNALMQARSAKSMNPDQINLLEKLFTEKPKSQEAEEMTPEQVTKAIAEAVEPMQKTIDALMASQKSGAKLSAATIKVMQECFDHMAKGYASIGSAHATLKGLMDGSGEEPGGINPGEQTPGIDLDADGDENVPGVSDGDEDNKKGIDLKQIDFSKYESLLPKAEKTKEV